MTKDLGTCQCGAPATGMGADGRAYCCPACLFNPLGCRCKYGEPGVAETQMVECQEHDWTDAVEGPEVVGQVCSVCGATRDSSEEFDDNYF